MNTAAMRIYLPLPALILLCLVTKCQQQNTQNLPIQTTLLPLNNLPSDYSITNNEIYQNQIKLQSSPQKRDYYVNKLKAQEQQNSGLDSKKHQQEQKQKQQINDRQSQNDGTQNLNAQNAQSNIIISFEQKAQTQQDIDFRAQKKYQILNIDEQQLLESGQKQAIKKQTDINILKVQPHEQKQQKQQQQNKNTDSTNENSIPQKQAQTLEQQNQDSNRNQKQQIIFTDSFIQNLKLGNDKDLTFIVNDTKNKETRSVIFNVLFVFAALLIVYAAKPQKQSSNNYVSRPEEDQSKILEGY